MPTVTIACFTDRVPVWTPYNGVLVAIDVLRASTTAITAIECGASLFPVATLSEARDWEGWSVRPRLLAGEQGGVMPDGFHLQNSPTEIERRDVVEHNIVLLSTSGTRLMVACERVAPDSVLVACLRNAAATADRLARLGRDVLILGADSSGELRVEDRLCAALIAEQLVTGYSGWEAGDEATMLTIYTRRPLRSILSGKSGKFLVASGQKADLDFVWSHVDDLPYAYVMDGGEVRRA